MEEGEEKEDALADLALIGAAQRVEHYEISGYTTARNLAQQLRHSAVVALLQVARRGRKCRPAAQPDRPDPHVGRENARRNRAEFDRRGLKTANGPPLSGRPFFDARSLRCLCGIRPLRLCSTRSR